MQLALHAQEVLFPSVLPVIMDIVSVELLVPQHPEDLREDLQAGVQEAQREDQQEAQREDQQEETPQFANQDTTIT